jgi:tRNA pseudouridine32 synthase/23S rRNA pseudouridine746 synthase/23S rRNA pseudouridine1911/1915/1917 synthase
MTPQELQDRLLYRDGLMLIIDKPAGLPVHAGPGGGPNLERHLDALRFGLPAPPALAHRLDRDTSGCLVLGRHRKALRRLGALFAAGSVEKVYWAIVAGIPAAESGRIELPLRKVTRKGGGWRMIVDRDAGQTAATDYRMLGNDGTSAWLELRPRTGRTHQIRVHCAAGLRCPVLGDPIYGGGDSGAAPGRAATPLHLHARSIAVPLYPNRPPVTAEAPPPPHMRAALARCGFKEEADLPATAGVTIAAPLR